jgi:hypothetical protein
MPPGVKPFSKDGAGGWRMEMDKDTAAGGHPPHQPAGIEGGDHQAVGPQMADSQVLRNMVESIPDRLQEVI